MIDDFFGIGDINATFLPPNPNKPLAASPTTPAMPDSTIASPASSPSTAPPLTPPVIDTDVAGEEGKIAKAKMLDELSESRPLAKLQRQMEEASNGEEESPLSSGEKSMTTAVVGEFAAETTATEAKDGESGEAAPAKTTTPPGSPARPRKPLLNPYDSELVRVSNVSCHRDSCTTSSH